MFCTQNKTKGLFAERKPLLSKRKPEQSFCYAPTEEGGCIFYMRFFSRILSREWRRRKIARIIHIPGCICRFALGFCKNIKKRTETLYQSFSPFMWNDSKNDTFLGYRFAIQLSFCIGCIWVQPTLIGCNAVICFPQTNHPVHS